MKGISVSTMVLGRPLVAEAMPAGRDWLVCVTGGCSPHVGSVSVACPTEEGVSVQTTVLPSHRDDAVSEPFARELAAALNATVCVSCGIHYDGIYRPGIDAVLAAAGELLTHLRQALCS